MKEFADFLGGQPPFDALDPDDMARLVSRVEVEYFAAGATVVVGGRPLSHLWVVRTGALEVVDRGASWTCSGPVTASAMCGCCRPPAAGGRAGPRESLCLRIPDPRTFLVHPDRLRFAAVDAGAARQQYTAGEGAGRADLPLARLVRPIVWCAEADRVRDVAERIGGAGLSCALVRTAGGLGIVTDNDFPAGGWPPAR